MKLRLALVSFSVVLVCACKTGANDTKAAMPDNVEESDKAAHPLDKTQDSDKAAVSDTGPYRTAQCQGLLEKYRARLVTAAGSCEQTSDCGHHGGVDPDNVCGGATDARTAKALSDVRLEMDDAGCMALPYSCPAHLPKCIDGLCGFEIH